MAGLIKELRRRKIFRFAGVYAFVAWISVQIAGVTFPALMLPDWSIRIVVVLAILGFPLVLVLAWAYESEPAPEKAPVDPSSSDAPAATEESGELPARPTLAVLPFSNMSSDPEQEHLADSLTEDLITDLSKTGVIDVIARNSVFQYRGESVDVRRAGRELGAHLILEGSVRKARDVVRFTAQLIDARTGHHLWADRQDHDVTNVLQIQDEMCHEISEGVVRALEEVASPKRSGEAVTADSSTKASAPTQPASGFVFAPAAEGLLPTQYALSGDLNIAYNVGGEGKPVVVYVPGIFSHVELMQQMPNPPGEAYMQNVLSERYGVISFDKRGQGMSDPVIGNPSLDERLDDLTAVMDAAEIERAILCGVSEGGPLSVLFASTYPDRVKGLILQATSPRFVQDDDYELGAPRELIAELFGLWGDGQAMKGLGGPKFDDSFLSLTELAALERLMVSKSGVRAAVQMICDIDVRSLLPTVRVPTLMVHSKADLVPVEVAHYTAAQIPGAEMLELEDSGHASVPDTAAFRQSLFRFCDRVLASESVALDSMLGTILAVRLPDGSPESIDKVKSTIENHDGRISASDAGADLIATFERPARAVRCSLQIESRSGVSAASFLHTGLLEISNDSLSGNAKDFALKNLEAVPTGSVRLSRTLRDLLSQTGLSFSPVPDNADSAEPVFEAREL